jgi:hypothetical protein
MLSESLRNKKAQRLADRLSHKKLFDKGNYNMNKVTVQYVYEGIHSEDENEIGVYFPAEGRVIVADKNGMVSIFNCSPTSQPSVVQVDLDNDGDDFSEDNPEYVVSLIMSAAK